MDEYLFLGNLNNHTKIAKEVTTYFEAFVFDDPADNIVREERGVEESDLEGLLSGIEDRPQGCVGGVRLM
jgi:hypothetical protein